MQCNYSGFRPSLPCPTPTPFLSFLLSSPMLHMLPMLHVPPTIPPLHIRRVAPRPRPCPIARRLDISHRHEPLMRRPRAKPGRRRMHVLRAPGRRGGMAAIRTPPVLRAERGDRHFLQEGSQRDQAGRDQIHAGLDAGPRHQLHRHPRVVGEGVGAEEDGEADAGGDEAAVDMVSTWPSRPTEMGELTCYPPKTPSITQSCAAATPAA